MKVVQQSLLSHADAPDLRKYYRHRAQLLRFWARQSIVIRWLTISGHTNAVGSYTGQAPITVTALSSHLTALITTTAFPASSTLLSNCMNSLALYAIGCSTVASHRLGVGLSPINLPIRQHCQASIEPQSGCILIGNMGRLWLAGQPAGAATQRGASAER